MVAPGNWLQCVVMLHLRLFHGITLHESCLFNSISAGHIRSGHGRTGQERIWLDKNSQVRAGQERARQPAMYGRAGRDIAWLASWAK